MCVGVGQVKPNIKSQYNQRFLNVLDNLSISKQKLCSWHTVFDFLISLPIVLQSSMFSFIPVLCYTYSWKNNKEREKRLAWTIRFSSICCLVKICFISDEEHISTNPMTFYDTHQSQQLLKAGNQIRAFLTPFQFFSQIWLLSVPEHAAFNIQLH